jgi:predicted metal-dependent HD superfamily phosphohydrolase
VRPEPPDARLLVDVDLAILAAPAPRFEEYERQVRREYDWAPEPAFRTAERASSRASSMAVDLLHPFGFAERFETRARGTFDARSWR